MSDFLSGLLSRNNLSVPGKGPETGLLPRPVSFYENLEADAPQEEERALSTRDERTSPAQPNSPTAESLEWLAVQPARPPGSPEPAGLPTPAPQPLLDARNEDLRILHPTEEEPQASAPLRPAPPQPQAILVRTIHETLASTITVPPTLPAATHHRTSGIPNRLLEDRTEVPVSPPDRPKLAQPDAERTAIRPAERFALPIPSSPESNPAPVIHISIGRIEVRATSSRPTTPPVLQGTPVMSLEEYLQSRDRGQR